MGTTIDPRESAEEALPFPQEALLIEAVPELAGSRIMCTSAGLAQFAGAASLALPNALVTCTYFDFYRTDLARDYWRARPDQLRIECAADLPDEEADVIALPFSASGEAELARDLIQSGCQRLRAGGRMFAATDNPRDIWLGEQLRKVFCKVDRRPRTNGVLHVATKTAPCKKLRDFSCEFAFRDRGRLIRAYSRPGVFSHRQIDPGARRLINAMVVEPGANVLDIGCGAGIVALAAACRAEGVRVHAVDSNARAIECTNRGVQLNAFTNVTTELNADGRYQDAGQYDLALANPPYYAGYRIARHFLTAGRAALRVSGQMFAVTKSPDWYAQNMPQWFHDVTASEVKGYFVFQGRRPAD